MIETNSVAHIQARLMGSGVRFVSQKEALDDVIRGLLSHGHPVNNKAIIQGLMRRLADETEEERAEALRGLLQLVVGFTPDDPGV